jgi:Primase C terminal 2 (PriCT-2)
MKLAINPKIIGKARQVEVPNDRPYYECQGVRVNLGWGWTNIEADWPDVFELITVDGYATSAELASDHRDDANFVSRELLMVDIDSGMTIEELLDNDWYNKYGAGFYATPSYRDDAPRFRILFRLAQPETDSQRLRKINRGLLALFSQADQACKDPTRIFYGTPNCLIKERKEELLTNDFAETLIQVIETLDAEQQAERTDPQDYPEMTDSRRRRIIDLLRQTYVGNYPTWRNVAWGLKQGGFGLQDFQYVTTGMMSRKTAQDAATVWNAGAPDGDVTMGTVIHLLKQHHGDDCLRIELEDQIVDLTAQLELKMKRLREIKNGKDLNRISE